MTSIRSVLSPPSTELHLSRLILERVDGRQPADHPLSIIELFRDASGAITDYAISPFKQEIPSTIYHDRPLRISGIPDRLEFQEVQIL